MKYGKGHISKFKAKVKVFMRLKKSFLKTHFITYTQGKIIQVKCIKTQTSAYTKTFVLSVMWVCFFSLSQRMLTLGNCFTISIVDWHKSISHKVGDMYTYIRGKYHL